MGSRTPDIPGQVRQFDPKEKPPLAAKEESPRTDGDPLDQSGQAIVAMLQQAANLSNENSDRALGLARQLSLQLHAAEGRIDQLQAEIEQFRDRAARGEKWLIRIYQEIEEKLISPRAGSQQALRQ